MNVKISQLISEDGEPETGLSPTIRIRDLNDGYTLIVTDAAMTESGNGSYYYQFGSFDPLGRYGWRVDGGVALANRYHFGGNYNVLGDTLYVLSYFFESGTPKTGLTPLITITDLSDLSIPVNGEVMTEVGDGMYEYAFTDYDLNGEYDIIADGAAFLVRGDRYVYANNKISQYKIINTITRTLNSSLPDITLDITLPEVSLNVKLPEVELNEKLDEVVLLNE